MMMIAYTSEVRHEKPYRARLKTNITNVGKR